jgi:hypothetical protein
MRLEVPVLSGMSFAKFISFNSIQLPSGAPFFEPEFARGFHYVGT